MEADAWFTCQVTSQGTGVPRKILWETPHRLTYYTLRVSTRVLREVGEDIKIIFLYLVLETPGHYKDTSGPTILPSTLLKHSLFFPLASPLWQKKKKGQ